MKVLIVLALIYGVYAGVMIILHTRFIYPFQSDDDILPGFHEVELTADDGTPIYVQEHDGDGPVLVYFMGNAGALPLFSTAFDRHITAGRQIIAMEYRGGGGRPGTPREDVLKSDALTVMNYAAAVGKPLIVQGYSMGTGIATYVATLRDVAGIILVAPYDSMCRLMTKRSYLPACILPFVDRWRSLDLARQINVPILAAHGEIDPLIPPAFSEGFDVLPNVERVIIKGAAHNDIGGFAQFEEAMEDFIAELPLGPDALD